MNRTATRILATAIALLVLYIVQLGVGQNVSSDNTALSQPSAEHVANTASAPSTLAHENVDVYEVVRVVDGDTLVVSRLGKENTVRLIGLDTPETVDPRRPVQCFGAAASQEAHRMLDGQQVRLETDSSQDSRDKYGRMLAYVFLQDGTLFNKHMIAEGFGHEYTYRTPYKYQMDFKAAEQSARVAQKGLWAPSVCENSSP